MCLYIDMFVPGSVGRVGRRAGRFKVPGFGEFFLGGGFYDGADFLDHIFAFLLFPLLFVYWWEPDSPVQSYIRFRLAIMVLADCIFKVCSFFFLLHFT